MIELATWLPQIMGYCEFVIDDAKLRRAWVHRDFSETSVTDFDELYEQVFDDLDAVHYSIGLSDKLPNGQRAEAAISEFLASLQEVDRARYSRRELLDVSLLLESGEWRNVRAAARLALDAAC